MKKWMVITAAFLLVVGGVYFGSPYYAANSLRNAALEADSDKLEASVDFPSVRESLKSQLSASLLTHMQNDPQMRDNTFAGLGALMMPAIIERAVDTFVTPDGIAALVRGQKPAEKANAEENPDIETTSEYLSADRFRVRLRNTKLKEDGPSLLFERRGFASWKLIKVQLPPNFLGPKTSDGAAVAPVASQAVEPNAKQSAIEGPVISDPARHQKDTGPHPVLTLDPDMSLEEMQRAIDGQLAPTPRQRPQPRPTPRPTYSEPPVDPFADEIMVNRD